jgi:PAS domain S-box-containing protein
MLFDAIADGVCAQSLDSRIVYANGAFADIIGAPPELIIGRACAEAFGCANDAGAIPQFCARLAVDETGCAAYEEISGKQPGRRLRSRVSPVRDESGKTIAYLMVTHDVTEVDLHLRHALIASTEAHQAVADPRPPHKTFRRREDLASFHQHPFMLRLEPHCSARLEADRRRERRSAGSQILIKRLAPHIKTIANVSRTLRH